MDDCGKFEKCEGGGVIQMTCKIPGSDIKCCTKYCSSNYRKKKTYK